MRDIQSFNLIFELDCHLNHFGINCSVVAVLNFLWRYVNLINEENLLLLETLECHL